jgi:hypothetical protein
MKNDPMMIYRTLATDVRRTRIDLIKDQVWEFCAADCEPPALIVQTTYGLQCKGMHLYPRFRMKGTTIADPRTFAQEPQLVRRFSDLLSVKCSPFANIDAEFDYWVPSSQTLCGRTRIANSGSSSVTLTLEWVALLYPMEKREGMSSIQMGVNTVLSGTMGSLFPVFFLTGGPQASTRSLPGLELEMTLAPGAERKVSWAIAALESAEASFTQARQSTALSWENEILKREMEEKRRYFHFRSEDPVLDDLLYETQLKAHQCLLRGPQPESHLFLLSRRQADAPLGDFTISPVTRQTNMPSSLYDFWLTSRILLPVEPESIREVVQTYLDTQTPDGAIPLGNKPDGTPTRAMIPPLLAGIARDVYLYLPDQEWLLQVFSPLVDALKCWLKPETPTWENLLQTGLDSSPLYAQWKESDQGVDIQTVDAPGLHALLAHECQALLQMSEWLGETEQRPWLEQQIERLKAHVLAGWNEDKAAFCYQDVASGESPLAELLHSESRNGSHPLKIKCDAPRRLQVRCLKPEGFPEPAKLILHGSGPNGPLTEEMHFSRSKFREGIARATSTQLYLTLERIEVEGLKKGERLEIAQAGYTTQDISLFLPLWAGLVSPEKAQRMIDGHLLPHFLTTNGLTAIESDSEGTVMPFWNTIIAESLLRTGFRQTASQIMLAFLHGIRNSWLENHENHRYLRASDNAGLGEHDALAGLPGVLPYLQCLGLEQPQTDEILIAGLNEFCPANTVQYGKVGITLNADATQISTLNGSKIEIRDADRHKIVLP